MSEAGERLIEGAKEMLAIAKGEQPAARIWIDGHAYDPVQRWRPIETAPTDGSEVIVYVPRRLGHLIAGARNTTGLQWWSRNLGDLKPTHWMPLPEPPR